MTAPNSAATRPPAVMTTVFSPALAGAEDEAAALPLARVAEPEPDAVPDAEPDIAPEVMLIAAAAPASVVVSTLEVALALTVDVPFTAWKYCAATSVPRLAVERKSLKL